MSIETAARHLGLSPPGEGGFTGVSCDSRRVREGMLFAAIPGERVDGHDFATQAAAAGASALLVSRRLDVELPQLVVEDVQCALGRLAGAWRDEIDPMVIGITGSNGKTTTKELVAQILRLEGPVLATSGNLNNELGLPLTLFELNQRHKFAVLEMGASKAGDIRYLAEIAKPDVGVITNVGPAHLQGFGDEEGVARAKGEMYASLPAEGFAIINADERWKPLWTQLATAHQRFYFGHGEDCDVRVDQADGHPVVDTPNGRFPLRLHLPGEHNVMNALAATAVACALGIGRDHIRAGLEATMPVPGRLNVIHAAGGWIVIDDTYNANPASLYAALQVLAHQDGERWLVLGDMLELGSSSRKLHAEMGEAATALGVQRLFAIGEQTRATADAFGTGARHFTAHDALIAELCSRLRPGVACLVKGSRSMEMERVVSAITGQQALREAG